MGTDPRRSSLTTFGRYSLMLNLQGQAVRVVTYSVRRVSGSNSRLAAGSIRSKRSSRWSVSLREMMSRRPFSE
uniref:Uncharacterized protein n=1 Tax=Streptomyces phage Abafar TaxID=3158855 RepID=A0AAU7GYF3_9CAUD